MVIWLNGYVLQLLVLEGTLCKIELLFQLALLQFQKPLYTLLHFLRLVPCLVIVHTSMASAPGFMKTFFGHHFAIEFELKYVLIFSNVCFKWVWTV